MEVSDLFHLPAVTQSTEGWVVATVGLEVTVQGSQPYRGWNNVSPPPTPERS